MNTEHANLMYHHFINENANIVKDIPKYVRKILDDDAKGNKNLF